MTPVSTCASIRSELKRRRHAWRVARAALSSLLPELGAHASSATRLLELYGPDRLEVHLAELPAALFPRFPRRRGVAATMRLLREVDALGRAARPPFALKLAGPLQPGEDAPPKARMPSGRMRGGAARAADAAAARTWVCFSTEAADVAPRKSELQFPADRAIASAGRSLQTVLDLDVGGTAHTEAQVRLAEVGIAFGYGVCVARNDRGRAWRGRTLESLALERVPPLAVDPRSQRAIEYIDLLWIKDEGQVAAAFEIETTTPISCGLVRMGNLAALAPNITFPLFVVVPDARIDEARRALSQPIFRAVGLDKLCRFFTVETLRREQRHIVRYGKDVDAIDKIAAFAARE